ncbi:MAG: hypothetical protein AVDCRST_MAG48-2709, partial [uncultured Friedmanniella sp.]
ATKPVPDCARLSQGLRTDAAAGARLAERPAALGADRGAAGGPPPPSAGGGAGGREPGRAGRRRRSALPAGPARAAPPQLARRRPALGVAPRPGRAGRRARGRDRGGAAGPRRRPAAGHPRPRGRAGRALADRAGRRRALDVAAPGAQGHRRRVPGAPRPPVGLPPEGGRPAHLGDPPAVRAGQGRAGGDPGRRVRRRPRGVDARGPLRGRHARSGPGRPLRALPQRRAGHHAGLGQHDDPVRPAPPAARRRRRPPGSAGDVLLAADAPLRQRPAPARLRRAHHPVLRRAHRGRRGARADRGPRRRRSARPRRARARGGHHLRGAGGAGRGRRGDRPPARLLGRRPLLAAADPRERGGRRLRRGRSASGRRGVVV